MKLCESGQFGYMQHIHTKVQIPPVSSSETFSSAPNQCHTHKQSPFLPSPSPPDLPICDGHRDPSGLNQIFQLSQCQMWGNAESHNRTVCGGKT